MNPNTITEFLDSAKKWLADESEQSISDQFVQPYIKRMLECNAEPQEMNKIFNIFTPLMDRAFILTKIKHASIILANYKNTVS